MLPPPTDCESFSKRARGRRVYNQNRQFQADLRLGQVIELLGETGAFDTRLPVDNRAEIGREPCDDLPRHSEADSQEEAIRAAAMQAKELSEWAETAVGASR